MICLANHTLWTNGKLTFTSHFISVQKEKNDRLSGVVGITVGLTTVNQKKRKDLAQILIG